MTVAVRRLVHDRAAGCCEYCHLPQAGHEERFSIDHIVAQQHLEDDAPGNLALCCLRCNLHKGTNLSGLDPADLSIVALFHPRQQTWGDHFHWDGPRLAGRASNGCETSDEQPRAGPTACDLDRRGNGFARVGRIHRQQAGQSAKLVVDQCALATAVPGSGCPLYGHVPHRCGVALSAFSSTSLAATTSASPLRRVPRHRSQR